MRCALLCLILLGACVPDTSTPPRATSSVPSAASASTRVDASFAIAVTSSDAGAPSARVLVPPGPERWRSVPREQNGFYAVLDGICSELDAGRVGSDVVVHYGGGHQAIYNDGKRIGGASFIALRDDGLERIGDPPIEAPTGIAGRSLDDFWIADSTGSRSTAGAVLHRRSGGQWKRYKKDQTNIHAWLDGGIIGSLGFAAANGEVWVEGSSTKPPESLYSDLRFPRLVAFPSGEVLVLGQREFKDSEPLFARTWAPGKKVAQYPLAKALPGDGSFPDVLEVAPDEIYLFRDDMVARWDGATFRALARAVRGEKIAKARRAAADDLWVLTESGAIQRITQTTATPIATPEPVVVLDGVEVGAAWIVGKSGKLYRREAGAWKPVPLPPPVFSAGGATIKAKGILVVAPDDVLLIAKYWEKGPGWTEQELHTALFRTKPVKETLRCNEPDPENNNVHLGRGFQSWPPMATAECKTPFVVLARRSNAVRRDDDWPRLRASLKGHAELGEVSLVDFVSGDRTFVGAKAKDVATAKALAALAAKGDRLRPEVVCGDPEPRRVLAIDLATGAATAR